MNETICVMLFVVNVSEILVFFVYLKGTDLI